MTRIATLHLLRIHVYEGPKGRKGEVFAYVGLPQNLKDLKDAGLCCGSRLRKGEVFAYVGSIQNLKDLTDLKDPRVRRRHADDQAANRPF